VSAYRPLIGIAAAGYAVPRPWGDMPVVGTPLPYVEQVRDAGGRAVLLPPGHGVDVLDAVDAVVLAGGDDVGDDPARDEAEVALAHAARDSAVPLLGVCRGLQVLMVGDGGSLLPEVPHRLPGGTHPLTVTPGSRLAGLLGEAPSVNSLHHQAADRIGAGWLVTALAHDGVVEGVEWAGPEPWQALAVQWHPEMDPSGAALFGWLVDAAECC